MRWVHFRSNEELSVFLHTVSARKPRQKALKLVLSHQLFLIYRFFIQFGPMQMFSKVFTRYGQNSSNQLATSAYFLAFQKKKMKNTYFVDTK